MNSGSSYDCAIIGGGVGGLTLAIQLAAAGKKVILFERYAYPFHRVCGEYISMESRNFLERIGFPFEKYELPQMHELLVSSPRGTSIKRPLDIPGFGISRYLLDETLAGIAREKGATILEEKRVTAVRFLNDMFELDAGGTAIEAKVVAGAFGKSSNIDQLLGRKFLLNKTDRKINYVAVKDHLRTAFPAGRVELHNFERGYCGMSQIENGLTNFSYIVASEKLRGNGNDLARMEENVLKKNPFLRFYLENSERILPAPLVISNVTFNKKTAVDHHLLMIGDAAGTIAPLSGNGMSMSMNASFIAAGHILRFLGKQISRAAMEEEYTRDWNRLFSSRILAGRSIQRFFGNSRLTDAGIKLAKKFPFLAGGMLKITHGKPY